LAQSPAAAKQLSERQSTEFLAEFVGCGDEYRPQLCECFAAHVDGAAAGDQQQPQRFPPLSRARQRERLGRESSTGYADGIEGVVPAVQPSLGPWRAAGLELRSSPGISSCSTRSSARRSPNPSMSPALINSYKRPIAAA
jgi:hypothetical protein